MTNREWGIFGCNMYCYRCGVFNQDDVSECHLCQTDLTEAEIEEDTQILTDARVFPLPLLIRFVWKNTHPLMSVIIIPFFSLLYCFRKLSRKPLLTMVANSIMPKYQLTDIKTFDRLHRQSFDLTASFFKKHGFEPFCDIEDVSLSTGIIQNTWLNREKRIYATALIGKNRGRVLAVRFAAVTTADIFLSADNDAGMPIQMPDNFVGYHFPGKNIEQLYDEFKGFLEKSDGHPRSHSLKAYLLLSCKLRRFFFKQGLEQGVYIRKDTQKANLRAKGCYHHPQSAAVRNCAKCGMALCEACYSVEAEKTYCAECQPDKATVIVEADLTTSQKKHGFAGFGIRAAAFLFDLTIIALLTAGVYSGLRYGISEFPIHSSQFLMIITQFCAVMLFIGWFHFPVLKYGCTPGQAVCGLRVQDAHGGAPDKVAVIIRNAYLLVAVILVFPLIGYLFVLFRKNKQGFHDQLADTLVLTRAPGTKAMMGWGILLALTCSLVILAYPYLFWIKSALFGMEPEITLKPRWEQHLEDGELGRFIGSFQGAGYLINGPDTVRLIDIHTGATIWRWEDFSNTAVWAEQSAKDAPLFLLYEQESEPAVLMRLNADTGERLWRQTIALKEPQIASFEQGVLVYNSQRIIASDLNGEQRFSRLLEQPANFDTDAADVYVWLNKEIIIAYYTDSGQFFTILDHQSGERLGIISGTYQLAHSIGDGRQCLYTAKGQTMMIDLSTQKKLWQAPRDIGYVRAHASITLPPQNQASLYLYSNKMAARGQDGAVLFAYPSDSRLVFAAEKHLLLERIVAGENGVRQKELVLLDKFSGVVIRVFNQPFSLTTGVRFLDEDDRNIYFTANEMVKKLIFTGMQTHFIKIDKETLHLEQVIIGRNIQAYHYSIKVLPEVKSVFIPGRRQIGTYVQ
ncbi:RDD family protein [Desulfococcaceae bacterium HSG9]|nr:RDD family protein [Desulfococcaceae bacterium HSG9]